MKSAPCTTLRCVYQLILSSVFGKIVCSRNTDMQRGEERGVVCLACCFRTARLINGKSPNLKIIQ